MRDLAYISGLTEAEFVELSKRAQAGVPVPPVFFHRFLGKREWLRRMEYPSGGLACVASKGVADVRSWICGNDWGYG